jgi:hypothetical protein
MGLAIMPDLIYRPWSLEGDRIDIRDVSGDLPSVQVGLAWRRGAPLSGPAATSSGWPRPRSSGEHDIGETDNDISKFVFAKSRQQGTVMACGNGPGLRSGQGVVCHAAGRPI